MRVISEFREASDWSAVHHAGDIIVVSESRAEELSRLGLATPAEDRRAEAKVEPSAKVEAKKGRK